MRFGHHSVCKRKKQLKDETLKLKIYLKGVNKKYLREWDYLIFHHTTSQYQITGNERQINKKRAFKFRQVDMRKGDVKTYPGPG